MKPRFALDLTNDAVNLLDRADGGGWIRVARVMLAAPDIDTRLAEMRDLAERLAPDGFFTKLILPNSQLLYLETEVLGYSQAERRAEIARALDGRTPYAVSDLVFDFSRSGNWAKVAVVAKITLSEAEEFASSYGFNPVGFVAVPEPGSFSGEPYFGLTAQFDKYLPPGGRFDRDQDPVRVIAHDEAVFSKQATRYAAEAAPEPAPPVEPTPVAAEPEVVAEPEIVAESEVIAASDACPSAEPEAPFAEVEEEAPFIAVDGTGDMPDAPYSPPDAAGDPSDDAPATEEEVAQPEMQAELHSATDQPSATQGFQSRRSVAGAATQIAEAGTRLGDVAPRLKSIAYPAADVTAEADRAAHTAPKIMVAAENHRPGQAPQTAPARATAATAAISAAAASAASAALSGASAAATRAAEQGGKGLLASKRLAKAALAGARPLAAASAARTAALGKAATEGLARLKPAPAPAATESATDFAELSPSGIGHRVFAGLRPASGLPTAALAAAAVLVAVGAAAAFFLLATPQTAPVTPGADSVALAPSADGAEVDTSSDPAAGTTTEGAEATDPAADEIATSVASAESQDAPAAGSAPLNEPLAGSGVETAADVPAAETNDLALITPEAAKPPEEVVDVLADPAALAGDAPLAAQPLPLPFGQLLRLDADGLIIPTPEGVVTPEGFLLIAGKPKRLPPDRPANLVPPPPPAPEPEPVQAAAPDSGALESLIEPATLALPDGEGAAPPVDAVPGVEVLPVSADTPKPRSRPASLVVPPPATADPATAEPSTTDPATEEALQEEGALQGEAAPTGTAVTALPPLPGPVDPSHAAKKPKVRPESIFAAAEAKKGQEEAIADAAAAAARAEAAAAAGQLSDSRLAVATSRRPALRSNAVLAAAEKARASAEAAAQIKSIDSAAVDAALAEAQVASASTSAESAVQAGRDEPVDEPEPEPGIANMPTTKTVAKKATVANAINLGSINLIGVYGSSSSRRALVRLPSGRFVKVKAGDRLDGGKVSSIGESQLSYEKKGKTIVLKMVKDG